MTSRGTRRWGRCSHKVGKAEMRGRRRKEKSSHAGRWCVKAVGCDKQAQNMYGTNQPTKSAHGGRRRVLFSRHYRHRVDNARHMPRLNHIMYHRDMLFKRPCPLGVSPTPWEVWAGGGGVGESGSVKPPCHLPTLPRPVPPTLPVPSS